MVTENKDVYAVCCCECNIILSYSTEFQHSRRKTDKQYCFLCMHSLLEFANLIEAPNLPTVPDLYTLNDNEELQVQNLYRVNCMRQLSKLKVWIAKTEVTNLLEKANGWTCKLK